MSNPNIVRDNGVQEWWVVNGQDIEVLHREDGPAVIWPDGAEEWYINGVHCRYDGPCVTTRDGSKFWALGFGSHRIDGPAITYPDGQEEWFQFGKRHRTDGPALIKGDQKSWHIRGKRIHSAEEFKRLADKTDEEMTALILLHGGIE